MRRPLQSVLSSTRSLSVRVQMQELGTYHGSTGSRSLSSNFLGRARCRRRTQHPPVAFVGKVSDGRRPRTNPGEQV